MNNADPMGMFCSSSASNSTSFVVKDANDALVQYDFWCKMISGFIHRRPFDQLSCQRSSSRYSAADCFEC